MRFEYLTASNLVYEWAKRLIEDLNRTPGISDLPVFADDAAAAAGNVPTDGGYVTPSGFVRRRMA
jgi:hypothetical protein